MALLREAFSDTIGISPPEYSRKSDLTEAIAEERGLMGGKNRAELEQLNLGELLSQLDEDSPERLKSENIFKLFENQPEDFSEFKDHEFIKLLSKVRKLGRHVAKNGLEERVMRKIKLSVGVEDFRAYYDQIGLDRKQGELLSNIGIPVGEHINEEQLMDAVFEKMIKDANHERCKQNKFKNKEEEKLYAKIKEAVKHFMAGRARGVCVWCPEHITFGYLASIHLAVRLSDQLSIIASFLCLVATSLYLDDAVLVADKELFKLARLVLLKLYEVCGLEVSLDKSQSLGLDEGMPKELTVLGFVWEMTDDGAVFIRLPKESIEKAEKALKQIIEDKKKPSLKNMQKSMGLFQRCIALRQHKTSAFWLRTCARLASEKYWSELGQRKAWKHVKADVIKVFSHAVKTLKEVKPIRIDQQSTETLLVTSYSDASLQGIQAELGGLIFVGRESYSWNIEVDKKYALVRGERKTIGFWEIFAILCTLKIFKALWKKKARTDKRKIEYLLWADNREACYSLLSGCAKSVVNAALANYVAEELDAQGANFRARWISSCRNIGDLPSRGKLKVLANFGTKQINIEELLGSNFVGLVTVKAYNLMCEFESALTSVNKLLPEDRSL